jgi:cathepsin A (carboxypeptidase C)
MINCFPNTKAVTDFFNRSHVMSILGARTTSYEWVNRTVNDDFASTGDGQRNIVELIPGILQKIPVLIFAVSVQLQII